jgi:hypothetical protein
LELNWESAAVVNSKSAGEEEGEKKSIGFGTKLEIQ